MKFRIFVILFFTQIFHSYSILFKVKHLLDDFIDNQFYFGLKRYFNTTRKDCVWRYYSKDSGLCDRDIKVTLHSNGYEEIIDSTKTNWLNSSVAWDSTKDNIFFIHGYAGGDNAPPLQLIREAFIQSNQYNLFLIDYGPVSRAPCYVSLINNAKYVSHCLSITINKLHREGMLPEQMIFIGHSMGAHVCGLLKYRLNFRMKKILALDPALPLISERLRVSYKDADQVHVIQTNAGYYGDIGAIGHVNICVNDGNMQPFCVDSENPNLCSHLWALCFTAQSLFTNYTLYARKCTKVCPHLNAFQILSLFDKHSQSERGISNDIIATAPEKLMIGLHIPKHIHGSYCLSTQTKPFCPENFNGFGSQRCCSLAAMFT